MVVIQTLHVICRIYLMFTPPWSYPPPNPLPSSLASPRPLSHNERLTLSGVVLLEPCCVMIKWSDLQLRAQSGSGGDQISTPQPAVRP